MKHVIVALSVIGLASCGANASAIRTAEAACLAQDIITAESKLAGGLAGGSGLEAAAIALTAGEITCALQALSAKGSGS